MGAYGEEVNLSRERDPSGGIHNEENLDPGAYKVRDTDLTRTGHEGVGRLRTHERFRVPSETTGMGPRSRDTKTHVCRQTSPETEGEKLLSLGSQVISRGPSQTVDDGRNVDSPSTPRTKIRAQVLPPPVTRPSSGFRRVSP